MKTSDQLPTLGAPVFTISEHRLEEKVTLANDRGLINTLVYFAVDATIAKDLKFLDDDMRKIIINKGMEDKADPTRKVEFVLDLDKNFSKNANETTIFLNEADAQKVAQKLNENQKAACKMLLELAQKAYTAYDDIIRACTTK